jgi:hypothetical protein
MSDFWPGIEQNITIIRRLHTKLYGFPVRVDVYVEYGHPEENI